MPGAKFCGSCGFTLQQAPQSPPQFNQSPNQPPVSQPAPPNQQYSQQPPPNYGSGQQQQQQNYGGQSQSPGGAFHFDSDGRGQGRGYTWSIEHQGAFALAVIKLQPEQAIAAEAGAMVSMSANVDLHSEMKGGIFGALKRAVGGESAFVSTFTARGGAGEVTFAPGAPGDVAGIEMQNQTFMVQSSSYLAGDTSLVVDTKFGGAKSFFGGEGLFVLQISGAGLLLVSSFGAIHRKTLRPGEQYVVDTGHLVAWEGHMQYNLRKAAKSGYFRSFLSGERVVAEFNGPGEILIQTRNLAAFAGLLKPFFPSQGGSGGGFNIDFGS
ncbi:MAG TPA: TIGR00266 family protein [Pyrinomonadaceae bacterium]|jgi:uncharacterized protein (TIGR00266 family)